MTSRFPTLALMLLVLGAAATGCDRTDPSLQRLRDTGVVRIGYAVEAPYAFVTEDGSVAGESPQIAARIATTIGIDRIAWRQMEFSELIDSLLADRIDVIAAGMFITPERQQRVLFSMPTLAVGPSLLLAHGNPKAITSIEQAARTEASIAVIKGAVEGGILRKLGVPENRIVEIPDALTGRRAIENGIADALMLSEPTLRWMARQDQLGRTQLLAPSANSPAAGAIYGRTAFAFRPDARALQAAWNDALVAYLRSDDHARLLESLGLDGLQRAPDQ